MIGAKMPKPAEHLPIRSCLFQRVRYLGRMETVHSQAGLFGKIYMSMYLGTTKEGKTHPELLDARCPKELVSAESSTSTQFRSYTLSKGGAHPNHGRIRVGMPAIEIGHHRNR